MANASSYLYKELNYEINGCAFEVFKEVGVGFREIIYHKFFHQKLLDKGLKARYKTPLQAMYRNEKIADFEVDEIVEDCIVVDAKFLQTDFIPENYAQIITYLKLMQLRLGLLINFGLHKAKSKRVIYDDKRVENTENWDSGFAMRFSHQQTLDGVLSSIRAVDLELGPGFHSFLYKAAIKIEFTLRQIKYDENVLVKVESKSVQTDPMEIGFWLIDNGFLFAILAGKDEPRQYDIFRMRSYLKWLKLKYGLIAYWSLNNLQIYGIYQP